MKLERFIQLDYDSSKSLAVMGKNQKAKLASKFFKERGIDFHIVDLENLHQFGELIDPQVLVAVYPAQIVRNGIVDLLHGFGLDIGRDCWWI